jgi:spore germination cell wall hydrolase CwlJ-like protein
MTPAMCLAIAMFFEARGEGPDGMRAVGEVIVNRVEHEKFPNKVCDVVFDGCKFSFHCDGQSEELGNFKEPEDIQARNVAFYLANDVLNGTDRLLVTNVTHYHTTSVSPYWSKSEDFEFAGRVGAHKFYSCENYC